MRSALEKLGRGVSLLFVASLISLRLVAPAVSAPQDGVASGAASSVNVIDAPKGSGIYSLDETLQFDDLHAVAFDPQNGLLTLLGEQRGSGKFQPVPYLNHLATALDGNHPTFSLPWTPEATRQADALFREAQVNSTVLWDRITDNARKKLFNNEGRLTKEGLRILQALNFPTEGYESYLTNKFDVMAKTFEICGGEQQARVVGAYARSLRDPDELNVAIRELAMGKALDASETDPSTAELWETFLRRFAGVFDADEQRPVEVFRDARLRGDHIVLARNTAVENILAGQEALFAKTFGNALELRAEKYPHIYLPPDLVRSIAELDINSVPTWNRVDPTSRMAEVMLDSDLLLKWIVTDPTLLGNKLPGHLTEYEWNRQRAKSFTKTKLDNVRFWISPDEVKLTESADGNVLEIQKFKMRVNTNDSEAQRYAAQLTSLYDELADRFPVLHELRETAKVVAVAEWLKRKVPTFRLPQEGRIRWVPTPTVPGFISINATVNVTRRGTTTEATVTGKWKGELALEGGVSLAFGQAMRADGSVLFDGAGGPPENLGKIYLLPTGSANSVRLDDIRQTIIPQIYDNEALKKIAHESNIPPPPMPPGAAGKADVGKRELKYISLLQSRVGDKANAAVMQQNLELAIHLATKLKFDDDLLNGMQAGRIRSMEAFQQVEDWARETREQMLVDAFDTCTGGASLWLGRLESEVLLAEAVNPRSRTAQQWALVVSKYGPKWKTLISDFDTARTSIGKKDKFDLEIATVSRGLDLSNETLKALAIMKETPVTEAAFAYGAVLLDALKLGRTINEINDNLLRVEQLGEVAGNEAQFVARLQKRRVEDLQKLQQVLQQLEAPVPNTLR